MFADTLKFTWTLISRTNLGRFYAKNSGYMSGRTDSLMSNE